MLVVAMIIRRSEHQKVGIKVMSKLNKICQQENMRPAKCSRCGSGCLMRTGKFGQAMAQSRLEQRDRMIERQLEASQCKLVYYK